MPNVALPMNSLVIAGFMATYRFARMSREKGGMMEHKGMMSHENMMDMMHQMSKMMDSGMTTEKDMNAMHERMNEMQKKMSDMEMTK